MSTFILFRSFHIRVVASATRKSISSRSLSPEISHPHPETSVRFNMFRNRTNEKQEFSTTRGENRIIPRLFSYWYNTSVIVLVALSYLIPATSTGDTYESCQQFASRDVSVSVLTCSWTPRTMRRLSPYPGVARRARGGIRLAFACLPSLSPSS